jgi:hypothetical protein
LPRARRTTKYQFASFLHLPALTWHLQTLGNGTFTLHSRGIYDRGSSRSHTQGMESTGRLLFVAFVTCYLLGQIFSGAAAPVEVVVYGMTAAFGLEYLLSTWGGFWQQG